MFNFKELVINKTWKLAAIFIVALLAGPEIMMGMELMAFAEAIGASTFVFAYLCGPIMLFLNLSKRAHQKLLNFERNTGYFLPRSAEIRQMPSLLYHVVPMRMSIYISLIVFWGAILASLLNSNI